MPGPGQQQEASSRRQTGRGPRARGSSRASRTEAKPREDLARVPQSHGGANMSSFCAKGRLNKKKYKKVDQRTVGKIWSLF